MNRLGFTGTLRGMSPLQKRVFVKFITMLLERKMIKEFHHGDAIGADYDAHYIVKHLSDNTVGNPIKIYIHPPINISKRAFCKGAYFTHEAKEYLVRNKDIVNDSDIMTATPKEREEQWRGSGTWATIRYSKKKNKPLSVIHSDGKVEIFNKPVEVDDTLAKIFG